MNEDPYERGLKDYQNSIYVCPYSPTSKASKRWHEAQKDCSWQELMDLGCYDDGGTL